MATLSRILSLGLCGAVCLLSAPADVFAQSSGADTEIRIQQMEREMREIRGTLEEQSFQLRRISEKLDLMNEDAAVSSSSHSVTPYAAPQPRPVATSTSNAGSGSAAQPIFVAPEEPQITPPSPRNLTGATVDSPPVSGAYTREKLGVLTRDSSVSVTLPQQGQTQTLGTLSKDAQGNLNAASNSAAAVYENAFSMLKSGNHAQAETAFNAFLKAHPNHELVPNAQYWLGETYYVRGAFERAARQFAEGYQKYPKGPKAPDNLLKLGMSLAGMGNKADACVALSQLEGDNFRAAANVQRRARQEMASLGC